MAFFRLKRGKEVCVYFWKEGKQGQIPRKFTKHLDGQSVSIIEEWIVRWEITEGSYKLRPDTSPVPFDWISLVDRFYNDQLILGRSKSTLKDHKRHLLVALPYFVSKGCKNLSEFPSYSRRLGPWLIEHMHKTPRRIHAINQSLKVWWQWLDNQGLVETPMKLTAGLKTKNKTPLKHTITPEDVKSLFTRPDIRLLMMINYFFSLRPQETLALTPSDFRTGSKASALECCKAMQEVNLYNKFAVNINKQRNSEGSTGTKTILSEAWVACFDEGAAREIARVLKEKEPDKLLFKFNIYWYVKLWKRYGIPNSVMKDLRRGSLYHLGHYSKLQVAALRNHARHSSIETTALYMRRPGESDETFNDDFDLDS